jgi:hypothetical protein
MAASLIWSGAHSCQKRYFVEGRSGDLALVVMNVLGRSPVIHSEVGYRFLYDDYHDTNFLYRVIMHGAQITLGLNF